MDLGAYQLTSPLASQLSTNQPSLVTLYPNPAAEQLTVRFAAGKAAPVRVQVLNLLAQQVLAQEQTPAAGETSLVVSLKQLAPGTYLVRVQRGSATSLHRVVVVP